MDKVTFTTDDIVSSTSEKSYEPARPELKPDTFFELAVKDATIAIAKKGYLQVALTCDVLDETGGSMGKQFVRVAIPVAFKGNAPGSWANGIFRDTMSALHSGMAAYDETHKDPITNKPVYIKGGKVLSAEELKESYKSQASKAKEIETALTNPATVDGALAELVGKRFFAMVKKDGDFTNLVNLTNTLPSGASACYIRKEAFQRAA